MVGLLILPVPAPIRTNPAAQELHHESLSVIPVPVPAQMNTAYHAQRKELHQESLQFLSGPASFKSRESVKTFVCVFCQGVVSLIIGEFLEFQVI